MNCIAVRAMTPYVPQKSCTGRPCKIGMPLQGLPFLLGHWSKDAGRGTTPQPYMILELLMGYH